MHNDRIHKAVKIAIVALVGIPGTIVFLPLLGLFDLWLFSQAFQAAPEVTSGRPEKHILTVIEVTSTAILGPIGIFAFWVWVFSDGNPSNKRRDGFIFLSTLSGSIALFPWVYVSIDNYIQNPHNQPRSVDDLFWPILLVFGFLSGIYIAAMSVRRLKMNAC